MDWIFRYLDHIFLLLVILFLTWFLSLWARNASRSREGSESENQTIDDKTDSSQPEFESEYQTIDRQSEFESEYQTVDAETHSIHVNSPRYEGLEIINKMIDSSNNGERWNQEIKRMIQQFKNERDSEISELKRLQESKNNCEFTDKIQDIKGNIEDVEKRIMKLETGNSDSTSVTIQEKRSGRMRKENYQKVQANLMYLIENIPNPTRLCLSLFSCGVFDRNDVERIKRSLQNVTPQDAIEVLIFTLFDSGENAYQPFLECLKQLGYKQVIERLEHGQGGSSNPKSEGQRLIAERKTLKKLLGEREKRFQEVLKEKESDLQKLQSENERICKELNELRNKMTQMENEKQYEKDERIQEMRRSLTKTENELSKYQGQVKETQQRIRNQMKNLESCVKDFKAATISEDDGLPQLEADITSLFALLQKSTTAEDGCTVNERQDTVSKNTTYFLSLDDACLKGDLNSVKHLIQAGHDINERYGDGMTPLLYSSQSQLKPVSKIKVLLDNGGNIEDRDILHNNNILHLACRDGRPETVDYLIALGLDVHSRNNYDQTPILYSSQSVIEPVSKIEMLRGKGGNIYDKDGDNSNILHLACRYGCIDTVYYLLEAGLNVQSRGFYDQTPILYSSKSYLEPVCKIKILLGNGGNIYDRDRNDDNMLHLACKYGRLETVDYLIGLGLDAMSKNIYGKTPVDCCLCSSIKPDEKIKLLEEKLRL